MRCAHGTPQYWVFVWWRENDPEQRRQGMVYRSCTIALTVLVPLAIQDWRGMVSVVPRA